MANEITTSISFVYDDAEGVTFEMIVQALAASVSSKKALHARQNIGFAAEEAIALGEITSPGWFCCINRDSTNYVEIRTATSGVFFAKLRPGQFCLLPLGSGVTAPFAQANTAACDIEYAVISN